MFMLLYYKIKIKNFYLPKNLQNYFKNTTKSSQCRSIQPSAFSNKLRKCLPNQVLYDLQNIETKQDKEDSAP